MMPKDRGRLKRLETLQPLAGAGGSTANPVIQLPTGSFFIDPISGSDSNTGTFASPFQTYAHLAKLWGTTSPIVTGDVRVVFLNDQPDPTSDPVVWTPITTGVGAATLMGTPRQISIGVLAGVIPKNRAVGQALTADLGAATTPGSLVVNTSKANSVAFVDEIVAGTTVILTQPMSANGAPPFHYHPTENNTWVNGDSFIVYQLTKVSVRVFSDRGSDDVANMFGIWIPQQSGSGPTGSFDFTNLSGVSASQCRIDASITGADPSIFNFFFNCWCPIGSTYYAVELLAGAAGHWGFEHSYIYAYAFVDCDIRLHRNWYAMNAGQEQFWGACNFAADVPAFSIFGEVMMFSFFADAAVFWGATGLPIRSRSRGKVSYTTTAVAAFPNGAQLFVGSGLGSTAITVDSSVDPVVMHSRALSPAQLDTPIAAVGLGGIGLSKDLQGGFVNTAND